MASARMHGPAQEPLGLQLVGASQLIGSALDEALTAAGGSLRTWMVLVSGTPQAHQARSGLSQALGMPASTPTEDVDALERAGLVIHKPGPENAGAGRIELTDSGEAVSRRGQARVRPTNVGTGPAGDGRGPTVTGISSTDRRHGFRFGAGALVVGTLLLSR